MPFEIAKRLKVLFFVSILIGILAETGLVLAAEVNVDYSLSQGEFQKYNQYVNLQQKFKGPNDVSRLPDAGIKYARILYPPENINPSQGTYTWIKFGDNHVYYGDDRIITNAESAGLIPELTIMQALPHWFAGGYYGCWKDTKLCGGSKPNSECTYFNQFNEDKYNLPTETYKSYYQTLIKDILLHMMENYTDIVNIQIFTEPGGANKCAIYQDSQVWAPNPSAADGTLYKKYYEWTSDAVKDVNANHGGRFRLGGPDISASAGFTAEHTGNFLDFIKERKDAGNPLQFDFVSYHHYVFGYSNNLPEDKTLYKKAYLVQKELERTGFSNTPHHIYEMNQNYLNNVSNAYGSVSAAALVASWKSLMDVDGATIKPFYWGLTDYGSYSSSVLAPRSVSSRGSPADHQKLDGYPDGTVFPVYNVFKMMEMQYGTRYLATSSSNVVHPLASGSSNAVSMIISRIMLSENIIVNITNLPSEFQSKPILYEEYLIDNTHSNAMYALSNQELELLKTETLTPRTNHLVTLRKNSSDSSVVLIKMTTSGAGSTVSTPIFSSSAGNYPNSKSVSISTDTSGATIHYTLDGTTPVETSTTYSTPITISSTKTIKAKAWKTGLSPSSIATATYIIESTPNDKVLFHEGAVFPSPDLAPIKSPYFLYWHRDGQLPNDFGSNYQISSEPDMTVGSWLMCNLSKEPPTEQSYYSTVWPQSHFESLKNRNNLALVDQYVFKNGQNLCDYTWCSCDDPKYKDRCAALGLTRIRCDSIDYTYNTMLNLYSMTASEQNINLGYSAITIDEYQGGCLSVGTGGCQVVDLPTCRDSGSCVKNRTVIRDSINALRAVKQAHPDLFVHAWYYWGLNSQIASGADVVDMFSSESYVYADDNCKNPGTCQNIIKSDVDLIKKYGLEAKSVIGLDAGCWDNTYGTPTAIDSRLKYIRSLSPQIASNGISLFWINRPGNACGASNSYRDQFNAVMKANFFDISPTVSITSPVNNAALSGTVTISASASPNTQTNRPIVSYRYFIDNKLVKISSSPSYSWNTAGYSVGNHILTVHAVSDDYLAGVSQINVSLGSSTIVAAPDFSPPAHTYSTAQAVSISTVTSGATIHYTLDGTTPVETSTTYSTPITISSTKTIKAKAWKTGLSPSSIATATYTIYTPELSSITILPASASKTIGSSQTFEASPKDQNGNFISAPITWTSSNITVGVIDSSTGIFSALAEGTATITARSGSVTGTATMAVSESPQPSNNIIANPGFESGTSSWTFYTNTGGSVVASTPGYAGDKAAKVSLISISQNPNIQLYQTGIPIEPNNRYRLKFSAYSSSGHDLSVGLVKGTTPTSYGLSYTPDLASSWKSFSTEFTSTGLSSSANDGRMYFWFASHASAKDVYYIDDIILENLADSDITPPVISNIQSKNLAQNSATIAWTTNEASDSQVEYGTTANYGSSAPIDASMVVSHSQTITGLNPSTLYHYRVKSEDSKGNMAASDDKTFSTLSPNTVSNPVISPSPITNSPPLQVTITSSTFGATIRYTTDGTEPSTSSTEYSDSSPITIISTTTVKAKAFKSGMTESQTVTAVYTLPSDHSLNLIQNPSFESGTSSWTFYTNTGGSVVASTPGYAGDKTAKISLISISQNPNIQLYQTGIPIEPNNRYRLKFSAYSSSGHDLSVGLVKGTTPTSYGLSYTPDLASSWESFSTEFTSTGLSSSANDGRLYFYLVPYAQAGDIYYIDNIILENLSSSDALPSVSITNPQASSMVSNILTISATASDDKAIAKVEFYIDDSLVGENTSSPYQHSWDTSSYTNALHIIKARAYDTIGQAADSSPITVSVYNNNNPVLSLPSLTPETGDTSTNFVYTITYTDPDNDAPAVGNPKTHILKAGKEISGSPFVMNAQLPLDMNYANGKLYAYSTLLSAGNYTYYFEAQDTRISSVVQTRKSSGPEVSPIATPYVSGTEPGNGAQNIPFHKKINILFSEPMRPSSSSAISISPQIETTAKWLSASALELTPVVPLSQNIKYSITVGTEAMSSKGVHIASKYTFSFTSSPQFEIILHSPLNKPYGSNRVLANITTSTTALGCEAYLNGGEAQSMQNSGTSWTLNIPVANEGSNNIAFECTDSATNKWRTSPYSFTIDTSMPILKFVDPTPSSQTIDVSYSMINITSNEPLSQAVLEWAGTNATMIGSGSNWYLSRGSLDNGIYTFNVYGTDLAGNTNKISGWVNVSRKITSYNRMNLEVRDKANNRVGSATIEVYDSRGAKIYSPISSISEDFESGGMYTIKYILPSGESLLINNLVLTKNLTLSPQFVSAYTGQLPEYTETRSSAIALNDSEISGYHAEITLILNTPSFNRILHCTSWDYAEASCSNWESNTSSDFGAYSDTSKIIFNVTSFDAYLAGQYDAPSTCSDNIKNQDETGIDCGGPCQACSSTNSGSDGNPAQNTKPVERNKNNVSSMSVKIVTYPETINASINSTSSFKISVKNTGDEPLESLYVEFSNSWFQYEKRRIEIAPGEIESIPIRLVLPHTSNPGTYRIRISILGDATDTAEIILTLANTPVNLTVKNINLESLDQAIEDIRLRINEYASQRYNVTTASDYLARAEELYISGDVTGSTRYLKMANDALKSLEESNISTTSTKNFLVSYILVGVIVAGALIAYYFLRKRSKAQAMKDGTPEANNTAQTNSEWDQDVKFDDLVKKFEEMKKHLNGDNG